MWCDIVEQYMKSTHIFIALALIICASLFFTYQRSFVTQDFEVIDSEEGLYEDEEELEESAEDEEVPEVDEASNEDETTQEEFAG